MCTGSRLFLQIVIGCTTWCAFFVAAPTTAHACGTIEDPFTREPAPITDCDNPFSVNRTTPPPDFPLTIAGSLVTDTTVSVTITEPFFNDFVYMPQLVGNVSTELVVYQEVDDNYQIVNVRAPDVSRGDPPVMSAFADYFAGDPDIALYRTALQTDDVDHLSDAQREVYFDFEDEVLIPSLYPATPQYVFLPGTYTLLFYEQAICLVHNEPLPPSWWQTLQAWLLPTAHAYCNSDPSELDRFTITLTITQAPPEPAGASSVLFLPGIQASRLYSETEKIWEPGNNNDVQQLAMTPSGESVQTIHTRDVIDTIPPFNNPIYDAFLDFLDTLQRDDVINDWQAYAYDWRYSVFDIAANGTQYETYIRELDGVVRSLASGAKNKHVTIVAHSNGGLLAKALLIEHPELTDIIDNIVFIGTPQLGTPKAIATILHGYDQQEGGGLVIDDAVARAVIANLPGVYGLLPFQEYFDATKDLVIDFDTSVSTAAFRETYGNAINDAAELHAFMTGIDGRTSAGDDVFLAGLANRHMLANARLESALLTNWLAPPTIAVTEVVGVGLDTERGFTYQEFPQWRCGLGGCTQRRIYKPVPRFTQYGDQTVVAASAEGYQGEKKRYYVDLKAGIPQKLVFNHSNITESGAVQKLVSNILVGEQDITIPFLSTELPEGVESNRVLIGTHSPVYLYIEDEQGRQTGQLGPNSIVEEIPSTKFFTLGGSSYIITPKDAHYHVYAVAYAAGGMTFTKHTLDGETQWLDTVIPVPELSSTTIVSTVYDQGSMAALAVDFENDGVTDAFIYEDGTIESLTPEIVTTEPKTTNEILKSRTGRRLFSVGTPQVAGITTSTIATADMADPELRHLLLKIIARLLLLQLHE